MINFQLSLDNSFVSYKWLIEVVTLLLNKLVKVTYVILIKDTYKLRLLRLRLLRDECPFQGDNILVNFNKW